MTAFPTLQAVIDARRTSGCGIHFINGETDARRLGFRELHARALVVLHHLQAAGADPGSELVILTERNEQFVDTFWACVLGRIVAVPIAPGSADEHRLKLFRVLARLERPRLVTERKVYERLEAFSRANGLDGELARVAGHTVFLDEIADMSRVGTVQPATPDDVALVQFSSGSTSEPKGVILTHRNLLTNIDALIAGSDVQADDRCLSWMPLTHDMGLIGFHLTPVVADIEHALMPTALFVRRPLLWLAKASQLRTTVLCSPNFGYKHYLKTFSDDKAAGLDLSAVRLVFNGAEPISAALCEEFLRTMAPYGLAPDVMFPVYGLAEASLAVAFPPPGRPLRTIALDRFALGTGNLARPVPADAPGAVVLVLVGQPIRDCSVRIAGEEGAPVTDGTIGRILIRGNNVTSGYYRDPVTTDATRSADGWLDTGDLGVVVDGELAITGRVKEILFVAGQNLYPHDIEAVIDKHAGVELGRAAVAGVRPAEAATDDVIVFVITKGQLADFVAIAREIRRVVNEHMAIAVAAVVPVTRLPKTTSGKIQRYALARDYEAGAFAEVLRELAELEGTTAKGDDDVGGTDIERTLLEICRAMLPAKHVGLDDNIFELGTSSLTLAQIYERVEAEYPGQLEVTDFFEFPTVRAMAGFLTRRMRGEA